MRSPQTQSPHPLIPTPHFHSTVSIQKLRRFNLLILVVRSVTFCFSLASSVFMLTNSRPSWSNFHSFRYVFAANAIVAVYSLFQMVASVWEISREVTLFPQVVQVWFDFTHDQIFAYLVLSACSAGTTEAKSLKGSDPCTGAFCLQSYIAIGFGFAGFLFLGFSALLSGFRVVCFIINGSRFHL